MEWDEGKAGSAVGSRLRIPGATRMGCNEGAGRMRDVMFSETIRANGGNMAKECGSTRHASSGLVREMCCRLHSSCQPFISAQFDQDGLLSLCFGGHYHHAALNKGHSHVQY